MSKQLAKALRSREDYFLKGDEFEVEKISGSLYRAFGKDGQGFSWTCVILDDKFEIIPSVSEWCSHCCVEVELKENFVPQECPNCKVVILPCAQCETQNCNDCPLSTERTRKHD